MEIPNFREVLTFTSTLGGDPRRAVDYTSPHNVIDLENLCKEE